MRVAVAVDHAGFPLKETVVSLLERDGHEVLDCGTDSHESVDYPVHAARAARLLSDGAVDRAVLACGTGAGVSIVANKFPGVRAVNARDPEDAEMSRRHNDANVLCLSAHALDAGTAVEIAKAWIDARFSGVEPHARRVGKIAQLEEGLPGPEKKRASPPARAARPEQRPPHRPPRRRAPRHHPPKSRAREQPLRGPSESPGRNRLQSPWSRPCLDSGALRIRSSSL